ncbi:MAG: DNA-directed RNA polymerase subunit H [Ignisphaera sp.]|nr:DNA-directed RNA polymerase subunit H [Ignisphaera sp.]
MPSRKKIASDLLQKILEHELVPKHEVLSIEEGMKILKEYGVKPEQLPWIRASDPVAKAIGAKPGDIVRIIRKSPTGGEIVVYRYVVPG